MHELLGANESANVGERLGNCEGALETTILVGPEEKTQNIKFVIKKSKIVFGPIDCSN